MARERSSRLEPHHLHLTMAGLTESLKQIGEPVRSGQPIANALTATRINGIIGAIRAATTSGARRAICLGTSSPMIKDR